MGIFQQFSASILATIVIGLATVGFSLKLATLSNIRSGVESSSPFLKDSTFIYRNNFGIPHITASNEHDVFFALGYAQAQDRLWQMDFYRRIARGRLAEVVGNDAVQADKFFRVLGLNRIADKLMKSVSKQSLNALEAYSEGVNAFIAEGSRTLPFEFGALDYKPEPWKPADCLVIGRLMSFDMSMSFWTDIAIGEIAESIGVEKALEFIPSYPASAPAVCDPITYTHTLQRRDTADMRRDTTQRDSTSRLNGAYLNKQSSRGAVAAMSAMMEHVRSIIGMKGMQSGSNCWVMRTSPNSKELVFANDPHLSLGLPPRWYQAHLSCPQFNVVGVTLPGIPVVISGRNDNIAWGITNMMLDDFDYFFEDVDAKNPAFYRNTEGIRTKFRYIRDTIIIKGKENEPYIFDYRSTNRSGIISDAHITKEQDKIFEYPAGRSSIASKYALSYSWTARESSDEILASLRIMRASSWTEFTNATLTWNTPALNFTYADERGNMGIAPSGFTPIRGEGNPNLPHPGWEAKFAWQGVRRSDALPRIYNPQRGYVFSANNLTMRGMDFHVSSLWEPPSRSERIMELLSEYQEYSSREAQFMQLDLTSPYSRTLLQTVLPVLRYDSTNFTPSQNQCIRTLANWDNVMAGNGNAAAIYTVFLDRLMANTFTARINPELYHKYAFVGSLPLRKLHEILQDSSASWFSDWGSQSKQKYKTVIILSLKEAQQHLESLYGEEMSQWRYADMHPLRLQHPLGRGTQLSSVVNKEVNTLGGDATTLNNTLWQINTPYDIKVGASMRFVCNMRDSVVYSVVPGGSSGQPLDAHYSDQLQLWSSGGYVTLPIGRKPHSGFELYATLVPATDRPSDQ